MTRSGATQLYDDIGHGYGVTRRTDPRIAAVLWRQLGAAKTVLNVGAGTGSYEPPDRDVMAVEPSAIMRAQRVLEAAPCVAGMAEALPFPDASFDVVLSAFSHWHWKDQEEGFAEMRRVARERVLVIALDRSVADEFWLAKEYLPNAHQLWGPIEETVSQLQPQQSVPIPIPGDCIDGFFHAFWRRPHVYLEPPVREAMAVFRRLDPQETKRGLQHLHEDLQSGLWRDRHDALLRIGSMDLGYRVLVHDCKRA